MLHLCHLLLFLLQKLKAILSCSLNNLFNCIQSDDIPLASTASENSSKPMDPPIAAAHKSSEQDRVITEGVVNDSTIQKIYMKRMSILESPTNNLLRM